MGVDTVSFKKMIVKKVRTLLLPYFLFAFISFLYWFFIGKNYGDDILQKHNATQYLTGIFLAIPSKEYLGFNLPVWFLPSLFCTEILFYFGKKIFKQYSFIIFIFCFGLGILLKEFEVGRIPYGLDVSLFALLLIQTGQWLKNRQLIEKYICNQSLVVKIGFAVIAFCLTCFVSQINQENGSVYIVDRVFNNYFLFFAGVFTGNLFILYLSNCLPVIRLFNFYGRNTIILLGLHLIVFSLIKGIQVFLLGIPIETTQDIFIIDIIYVIFVFILLAPVIYCVNKYMPFLLGRKKGWL
jgi:fucose 4-O-acetylase-like acetyltransferase